MYASRVKGTFPQRRSTLSNVVEFNNEDLGNEGVEYEPRTFEGGKKDHDLQNGSTFSRINTYDRKLNPSKQGRPILGDYNLYLGEEKRKCEATEPSCARTDTKYGSGSGDKGGSNDLDSVGPEAGADWASSSFFDQLMGFSLFHNSPRKFYFGVVSKLKLVIYHPQDCIVRMGEPSKSMYWLLRGTVSVTSPDGEFIHATLDQGSYFGEIGILFNRPRTATVVATTKVLVGLLTAENFSQVLKDYPMVERQIRDEAQERLAMQDRRRSTAFATACDQSVKLQLFESRKPLPSLNEQDLHDSTRYEQQYSLSHRFHDCIPESIIESVSIRQFLKGLPLFTTLPRELLQCLTLSVKLRRYEASEYIFHVGTTADYIYFILGGEVNILGPSLGGSASCCAPILGRFTSGQYFGVLEFLMSMEEIEGETGTECKRVTCAKSVSGCTLLLLDVKTLNVFCTKHPWIKSEIKKTVEEHSEIIAVRECSKDNIICLPELKKRCDMLHGSTTLDPPTRKCSQRPTKNVFQNTTARACFEGSKSIIYHASKSPSPLFQPISSSCDLRGSSKPFVEAAEKIIDRKLHYKLQAKKIRSRGGLKNGRRSEQLRLSKNFFISGETANSSFGYNRSLAAQHVSHYKIKHYNRIIDHSIDIKQSHSEINCLPDNILARCFEFITLPELMRFRLVCRRWRQLLYVAPRLFEILDLTRWNKSINDKVLIQITDFVGTRPKSIDISNCYHITDYGFSYMINEIGIGGQIRELKMKSCWEVSAMAIMDITAPSIGQHIEKIDLTNCRKVRDDVTQRLLGWENQPPNNIQDMSNEAGQDNFSFKGQISTIQDSKGGVETPASQDSRDANQDLDIARASSIGCRSLRTLVLRYCKNITDLTLYHISIYGKDRLTSLDLTRCTGLTNMGFAYWAHQSFVNLRTLILSECIFLSDASVRSIVNCAPNLENLNVSFCFSLTDVSVEVIWLGCRNLKVLDLSFCGRAVSNLSLLGISMHLRKLERFSLKGCLRVTRTGVDSLLGGFAPLKFIDISQCKNAHFYQGGVPATKLQPAPGCRSIFLNVENCGRCIEVVV